MVAGDKVDSMSIGYFEKDGLLMRKWTPLTSSVADDWSFVTQIVVPVPYRTTILNLAHDNPFAGHLGVKKMCDRVLRHFFWLGLKKDVARYCKFCHTCQVAGKPNQTIPPAPLCSIPEVCEPFERVLVDCVGPLPRTKAGNTFLVTVMCASTRFPEVFPVHKITTPIVVKVLTMFFSLFGLPKVVQTDQGSNFMSRVFAQVLKQLNTKHCHSSAYHPESQGALEHFHQTLKTMLRTYCLEFERDWDDGVHMQMFAIREVVQESLRFSPSELVFAHTVRGPLKLLSEKWLCEGTEQNLLDYVSNFRFKLRRACEIARDNLKMAEARIKGWFDKHAKSREFQPGDKVLVLLPIPGSSLQARYSGPYLTQEKVGDRDYLVATPDRLCHINMLKRYCDREKMQAESSSEAGEFTVSPVVLSGAEVAAPCVSLVTGKVSALSSAEVGDRVLSEALTKGKLSNSEILEDLPTRFLSEPQRSHLIEIIESNRSLFADVPSQTQLLKHDIDVRASPPIKQHPY